MTDQPEVNTSYEKSAEQVGGATMGSVRENDEEELGKTCMGSSVTVLPVSGTSLLSPVLEEASAVQPGGHERTILTPKLKNHSSLLDSIAESESPREPVGTCTIPDVGIDAESSKEPTTVANPVTAESQSHKDTEYHSQPNAEATFYQLQASVAVSSEQEISADKPAIIEPSVNITVNITSGNSNNPDDIATADGDDGNHIIAAAAATTVGDNHGTEPPPPKLHVEGETSVVSEEEVKEEKDPVLEEKDPIAPPIASTEPVNNTSPVLPDVPEHIVEGTIPDCVGGNDPAEGTQVGGVISGSFDGVQSPRSSDKNRSHSKNSKQSSQVGSGDSKSEETPATRRSSLKQPAGGSGSGGGVGFCGFGGSSITLGESNSEQDCIRVVGGKSSWPPRLDDILFDFNKLVNSPYFSCELCI